MLFILVTRLASMIHMMTTGLTKKLSITSKTERQRNNIGGNLLGLFAYIHKSDIKVL